MALTSEQAQRIALSCSQYDVLAAGVAQLLIASPDPSRWTDTGLMGASVFVYGPKADLHLIRMYSLDGQDLLFEMELYEDFSLLMLSERVLAWEADDFVMALAFSLATDADDFFSAVVDEAPRSSDSLQLLAFKNIESKQRAQRSGFSRFFGGGKKASKAKDTGEEASLEAALRSAQGCTIELCEDGSIDPTSLSPQLRRVFKKAGIRKRDLRSSLTSGVIMQALKEVGVEFSDASPVPRGRTNSVAVKMGAFTIIEEGDEDGGEEEVDTADSESAKGGEGCSRSASLAAAPATAAEVPVVVKPKRVSTSEAQASAPSLPTPVPAAAVRPGRARRSSTAMFAAASAPVVPQPEASASATAAPASRQRRMSRRMLSAVAQAGQRQVAQPTLAPSMEAAASEEGEGRGEGGSGSGGAASPSARPVPSSAEASETPTSNPTPDRALPQAAGGDTGEHATPSQAAAPQAARQSMPALVGPAGPRGVRGPARGRGRGGARGRGRGVKAGSLPNPRPMGPRPSGGGGGGLLSQIQGFGSGGKAKLRKVRRPTEARRSVLARLKSPEAVDDGTLMGRLQATLAKRRLALQGDSSSSSSSSEDDWSD